MKYLKIVHLIIFIAILITGLFFGKNYSYNDIKDILSTLQNISAMIFTIAGIWLAYIYPTAVKAIVRPSKIVSLHSKRNIEKDMERITMIVKTIIVSAIVIFSIICINVFKPLLINIPIIAAHKEIAHQVAFIIAASLVYLQVLALFGIISSNILFLNDLHDHKNNKELNKLK
ncbi:hypothetical protein ACTVMN_10180 [Serratia nematodiphila]